MTDRDTVEVAGVWLQKSHAHLGNKLVVLVQLEDGSWRRVIDEVADDGPISHIVEPRKIRDAPTNRWGE